MTYTVSTEPLAKLSGLVATCIGLHFPKERWPDLKRGISAAAKEFGFDNVELCIDWLLTSPLTREQIDILASHLTVGETYFLRDKGAFSIMEEHIIPELIQNRRPGDRHLRIWSAGCATGEEPYSIAMLLSKIIPNIADWTVTILATDINNTFMKKASQGVYGEWSFRDCPQWIKDRHFTKTGRNLFGLVSDIRQMVTFSYHNLVEDPYPSLINNTNAMDIIFCRNVLMYFNTERAKKVIQGFYDSLVEGGWLIVAPCEASPVLYPQYKSINISGITLFRRDSRKSEEIVVDILPQELPEIVDLPMQSVSPMAEIAPELNIPIELVRASEPDIQIPKPLVTELPTYEQVLALYERGSYAEAEVRAKNLLSLDATNTKTIILLARIYANRGQLTDALDCCRKAIAVDKLNPIYYYLAANILQEQNQIEDAIKSLKRALYLDQYFVLAHFALGNLTYRQQKLKESGKHYQNALFILGEYKKGVVLPESEGMTAGRLEEIIRATLNMEKSV